MARPAPCRRAAPQPSAPARRRPPDAPCPMRAPSPSREPPRRARGRSRRGAVPSRRGLHRVKHRCDDAGGVPRGGGR
jgi:hypothetical protein